ncbi:MAG: sulfurtransferase [Betaproteobacteria bacterium]
MSHTTLVTVADLQAHLFDRDWVVVDCRHDLMNFAAGWEAFGAGHIPGATFAHVEEDLSGTKTGSNGRHPLPDRDALEAIFREWGIGNGTQIVAYDAQGGQFAARLWWLARWLGHERVAVLDGGWPAWLAATQWASVEEPDRPVGDFEAGASLVEVADAAQVLSSLGRAQAPLLDARAAERYRGEQEPIDPVAGHIPGAANRFWQSNLADGNFKPAPQLRAEYDALLAGRAPAQLTHYCGSGVSAAHNALSMEIAGLPGSKLYAGSWSEWIADKSRPVVDGDGA